MRIHHVLSASALSFGVACTGEAYVEPAAPPPPPPVAYVSPPPTPAEPTAAEVDYYDDEPVADIDAYPSVVYGGATFYFVGGYWYRHDPRGWGRLRVEPPELARER